MVDSLCFTVCNYNYRAKVQKKMHTRKKKCFFLLVNEEEPLLSSVKKWDNTRRIRQGLYRKWNTKIYQEMLRYSQKIALKVNFPRIFFVLCIFFCTFAL